MSSELVVAVVVVAMNCGFFDGSVHALDLAVGPGMVGFGKPVFDGVAKADAVEGMPTKASGGSSPVLGQIGKLDAVVGQDGVDAIGDGGDQSFQKGSGGPHIGTFDQLHKGELGSTIDGHEEIEFSFGGAHFGQIDVEVADSARTSSSWACHLPLPAAG